MTLAIGLSLAAFAWLGGGPSILRVVFAAASLWLVVSGGAMGVAASGDLLAAARIGPARFEVRPDTLRPGEEALARLELCPRWGSRARRIDFTLAAERRLARQVGSRSHLEIVRLASASAEASGPTELQPGVARAFEVSLLVPPGVPGSSSGEPGGRMGTFWYVEARVRLARWPDWQARVALNVVAPAAVEPGDQHADTRRNEKTR